MDEGKVERMVAELLPLGSLFDTKCQSSWWACHKTSAFATGLSHRGRFV